MARITGTDNGDYILGGIGLDTIIGLSGDDTLVAWFGGPDSLSGGEGNDSLYGSLEAGDTLDGGRGNDVLLGTPGTTYIFRTGDGKDTIYHDHVNYRVRPDELRFGPGISPQDVMFSREGNALVVRFNNSGDADSILIHNYFGKYGYDAFNIIYQNGQIQTNSQIQLRFIQNTVNGTNGSDVIVSRNTPDIIMGLDGDDVIISTELYDYDIMVGGKGDDVYRVADASVISILERPSEGVDTLVSQYSFDLPDNVENGVHINDFINSEAPTLLYGNALNNIIVGNQSWEIISGGLGRDRLDGGGGKDVYQFGYDAFGQDTISAATNDVGSSYVSFDPQIWPQSVRVRLIDTALEISIAGQNDKLIVEGFYTGGTVHNGTNPIRSIHFARNDISWSLDTLVTMATSGMGTEGPDTLIGTDSTCTLAGLGGDDTLSGLDGNDLLDGGAGADLMSGGNASDTYIVDNAGDVVVEYFGQGTDWIESSISWTLGQNVENLFLTGYMPSAFKVTSAS